MTSATATTTARPNGDKNNIIIKANFSRSKRLLKIDKSGKIYIPKVVRDLFKGYRFFLIVENGKLTLDPVKVDDEVSEG